MGASSATGTTEYDAEKRTTTDWYTIVLLFFAGIGSAMHFAKVPAALPQISAELGLSPVAGGLAVSLVALLGIVFGVAAGGMVDAWGRRRLLILSLIVGAITSALIPLLPTTPAFMTLRTVEGLSHLAIVVAAPSLMSAVAQPRDRTIVMTIWGSFFAVGFALTDAVAPGLLHRWNWQSLFWLHAALFLVIAALLAPRLNWLAHRQMLEPPASGASMGRLARDLISDHGKLYRNGPILAAAAAFVWHCLLFNAYLTYVRQLLMDEGALHTKGNVGAWMSLLAVLSIGSTILIGGALLWMGVSPFHILVVAFAGEAVSGAVLFTGFLGVGSLLIASIALFVFDGCVQGATFATIPVVASDRMAALAHGAFAQAGNLGSFIGPPLFAVVMLVGGWPANAVVIAIGCLAGIFCTVLSAALARRTSTNAAETAAVTQPR